MYKKIYGDESLDLFSPELWYKLSRVFCAGILFVLLSRCGSSNNPASGTFSSVYQALQANNCTQCHVTGTSTYSAGVLLDFTTQATAFTTLTTLKVTGPATASSCPNVSIAVSKSPTTSYFIAEVYRGYTSTTNYAGVTGCTPYAGHSASFSAAEQTSAVAWVNAGLPNN